tara:strand:+ start:4053 stop:4355 length:303 start_codon:yes stop_codon:yes gene_type:complete
MSWFYSKATGITDSKEETTEFNPKSYEVIKTVVSTQVLHNIEEYNTLYKKLYNRLSNENIDKLKELLPDIEYNTAHLQMVSLEWDAQPGVMAQLQSITYA